MSLAEIEAATEALPPEQKEELFRFLAARLRLRKAPPSHRSAFNRSRRGFPISQGRESFASEDVARLEAQADALL